MQIRDLSVPAELADVRGGVGHVTGTLIDQSYNRNDSDIDFLGGATTVSGGIQVSQLLDARKQQVLSMPVHEYQSDRFELGLDGVSVNVGW